MSWRTWNAASKTTTLPTNGILKHWRLSYGQLASQLSGQTGGGSVQDLCVISKAANQQSSGCHASEIPFGLLWSKVTCSYGYFYLYGFSLLPGNALIKCVLCSELPSFSERCPSLPPSRSLRICPCSWQTTTKLLRLAKTLFLKQCFFAKATTVPSLGPMSIPVCWIYGEQ